MSKVVCMNDNKKHRRWGRLNPKKYSEVMYHHNTSNWACPGGKSLKCPSPHSHWESESASKSGCPGYCFGDFIGTCQPRRTVKCYRDASTYKKDAATLLKCCVDPSPKTQIECAPGYCPASDKCDGIAKSSCSATFVDADVCKPWCAANPGKCDQAATKYCAKAAKGDPFCACINSPAGVAGASGDALASCFDGACIARGYKMKTMIPPLQPACPSICQQAVNCYQQEQGSCAIDQNTFSLTCGGSLPPDSTPADGKPADGKPADKGCPLWAQYDPTAETCKTRILFIVLAFIVLIMVALGVMTLLKKEPLDTSRAKAT